MSSSLQGTSEVLHIVAITYLSYSAMLVVSPLLCIIISQSIPLLAEFQYKL